MIKIVNNDIMRDGQKVGWIENDHIFGHNGEKMGRVSGNDIYDHNGNKRAYIEGEHTVLHNSSKKISLDETRRQVQGGTYSDTTRAAVHILMGD